MAIKIICRPNGPYLVENDGSIELYDAIGTKVDLTGKAKFALCRCGGHSPEPWPSGACRPAASPSGAAATRLERPPQRAPAGSAARPSSPTPPVRPPAVA